MELVYSVWCICACVACNPVNGLCWRITKEGNESTSRAAVERILTERARPCSSAELAAVCTALAEVCSDRSEWVTTLEAMPVDVLETLLAAVASQVDEGVLDTVHNVASITAAVTETVENASTYVSWRHPLLLQSRGRCSNRIIG